MNKKSSMTVAQKTADLSRTKSNAAKKRGRFFRDMKEEMRKVSWTNRDELRTCGKIVIGSIFIFGLGIYFTDLFVRLVLDGVGNLVRLIGA